MKIHGHITLLDSTVILTNEIEAEDNEFVQIELEYEDGNPVGAHLVKVPRPEDG